MFCHTAIIRGSKWEIAGDLRNIFFLRPENSDVSYRVCDFVYREKSFNFVTIKPEMSRQQLKVHLCELIHLIM